MRIQHSPSIVFLYLAARELTHLKILHLQIRLYASSERQIDSSIYSALYYYLTFCPSRRFCLTALHKPGQSPTGETQISHNEQVFLHDCFHFLSYL